MLTTDELLGRLDNAIKAITTATLGGAKLAPEKAQAFVRSAEVKAKILPAARRLDMKSHTRDIDRVGFGSRILQGATENTAPPDSANPTYATNQLVSAEVIAVVGITDSALEDNIESENFEDTLVQMMGERAGIDLEELYMQGDKASADTFLAKVDGWLKRAANVVSGTITDAGGGLNTTLSAAAGAGTSKLSLTAVAGAAVNDFVRVGAGLSQEYFQITAVGAADITINGQLLYNHAAGEAVVEITAIPGFNPRNPEAMFEAMLQVLPEQYKQRPEELVFWVPWAIENDYRDVLRSRGTALGDAAQRDAQPVSYKGVPVTVSAAVPAGKGLLSHPDNMVFGIYRDIKIEPDRVVKARRTDFVLTLRTDANFEDENGAVAASGYIGR